MRRQRRVWVLQSFNKYLLSSRPSKLLLCVDACVDQQLADVAACLHTEAGAALTDFHEDPVFLCGGSALWPWTYPLGAREQARTSGSGQGVTRRCFVVGLAAWRGSLTWEDKERRGQQCPATTLRTEQSSRTNFLQGRGCPYLHRVGHMGLQVQPSKCGV